MMVSGSDTISTKRSSSSGVRPSRTSPSRVWRALAAITWAKPSPPESNEMWPLAPVSTRPRSRKQAPRVGREVVRAIAFAQELVERRGDADDELVMRAATIGRADLAGVEVLDDQPAARCEPGNQLIEHVEAGRDVLQHEPLVDEVPRALRDRAGHHVELLHLELCAAVVLEPSGVEVDGHHLPLGTDARGEPAGDRATTGPDLQAPVARPHPDAREVLDRDGVEASFQSIESSRRLGIRIAHQVRRLSHGDHLDIKA